VSRLPVIIAAGGINPAGRVSAHRSYQRLVVDALGAATAAAMYRNLATLMALERPEDPGQRAYMRDHTLVRRIESFDVNAVPLQRAVRIRGSGDASSFLVRKRDLPPVLPATWEAIREDASHVEVRVAGDSDILVPGTRDSRVSSAGQLPTGFDPGKQYAARSHPRGLQLAVCGASDAVQSLGVDWQSLRDRVRPDQIAVYSASAMGQLDYDGAGGVLQAHLLGKRPTSKQIALSLSEMPADFINAYVLGSVGGTAGIVGACATFLYNLQHGIEEIRCGRRRIVVVGNAEAPITPEIIEAYRTMGALAEDEALAALDGATVADHRRACRPFSDNCGFTLAEAGVYFVIVDDELAVELGANILGAIGDVFVNADGYKKSIPGPGIGNYLTMGKALALTEQLLGSAALRQRTFVQAHGTSTPQNRVTESHILSTLAGTFGIEDWIVCACKAYLGHTIAAASADQLAVSLGIFAHGIVPGIVTIDHLADDVHRAHLRFPMQHVDVGAGSMDAALINSKGFGGNNATAVALAPHVTMAMLERKHGAVAMAAWARRNEAVQAAAAATDAHLQRALLPPIYQFGEGVVEGEQLEISRHRIRVPGFAQAVELVAEHPYPDMR